MMRSIVKSFNRGTCYTDLAAFLGFVALVYYAFTQTHLLVVVLFLFLVLNLFLGVSYTLKDGFRIHLKSLILGLPFIKLQITIKFKHILALTVILAVLLSSDPAFAFFFKAAEEYAVGMACYAATGAAGTTCTGAQDVRTMFNGMRVGVILVSAVAIVVSGIRAQQEQNFQPLGFTMGIIIAIVLIIEAATRLLIGGTTSGTGTTP